MILAPVLPSVETSPPALPATIAPPFSLNSPPQITSHHQALKAKNLRFLKPDLQHEHELGPVATAGSETVYHDIYTWVERLKDLVNVHGPNDVKQIIQLCLPSSAATLWMAELTEEDW